MRQSGGKAGSGKAQAVTPSPLRRSFADPAPPGPGLRRGTITATSSVRPASSTSPPFPVSPSYARVGAAAALHQRPRDTPSTRASAPAAIILTGGVGMGYELSGWAQTLEHPCLTPRTRQVLNAICLVAHDDHGEFWMRGKRLIEKYLPDMSYGGYRNCLGRLVRSGLLIKSSTAAGVRHRDGARPPVIGSTPRSSGIRTRRRECCRRSRDLHRLMRDPRNLKSATNEAPYPRATCTVALTSCLRRESRRGK